MQIGPFLGINNRLPDYGLHVKTDSFSGDYLKSATNVDIDNKHWLRRRKQLVLQQAMTGAHSIYMTSDTAGYLVRGSVLYSIILPTYSETLFKTLTANTLMSYVATGDDLYYSNGTDSGRISSGVVYPWALPTPSAPTISSIGGSLLKGNYRVAVSHYNNVTGEEGGLSAATQTALTTTGGLRVTLPTAVSTHVNVYLSGANGGVMQLSATVAAGTATYDLISLPTGKEAAERRDEPLPAGELFLSNGRLCSFSGDALYRGHPYRYGYHDPIDGVIRFPCDISVAVDAQTGVFVAADKTYWVPNEGVVADILPYGAVPGTAFTLANKTGVGWFGEKGIVLGKPSGEIEAVMSDNIDLTPPASGFSMVIEDDEYRRVVSCDWCMNLANKAATQYANWGVTSHSRGFVTTSTGIYSLASGGDVTWSVDLGKQNLGSDMLKHLPNAYLGVESSDLMQLIVSTPDSATYTYDARSYDTAMREQRIDVGKGLRANWFDLSLTARNGADFKLSHATFSPIATKRRI